MTAKGTIENWLSVNKETILGLAIWIAVAAIGGFATSIIPAVPSDSKLIDLAIAGTVVLNIFVVYLAFVGSARLTFKPSEGFLGSLKFAFRKDMLTTVVGVLLFVVVLISIPPMATQGAWHIPVGTVAAIAFLGSWMVLSFVMRRIYAVQFFEEVLSVQERAEYEEKMNAKTKKTDKSGMFLVDLGSTVRGRINKVTRIEKARTHKLIFPFIQSLLVLLSPSLLLFWTLWAFPLSIYTTISAIGAPVVMVVAALVWAKWHIRGGFTRIVGRRKGRVMESVSG